MAFPWYVHSVVPDDDPAQWPIQQQGENECGCTAPANALNILLRRHRFSKDQFIQEAGILFQRYFMGAAGGTPSFVTGWLIKRHGFGTHFGSLRKTNAAAVLEDLIRRRVPVVVEIGANRLGPLTVWGQHSMVLVGYSDPYRDTRNNLYHEYYFVDAQYPSLGDGFGLATNDVDRDGDGIAEHYPGNRTIPRDQFLREFPTGIYYPVFPSQQEHDAWADAHLDMRSSVPVLGKMRTSFLTGTTDIWRG